MEEDKIIDRWAEYIGELFEEHRKGHNVMKHSYAGPPIMKDEIRSAYQ